MDNTFRTLNALLRTPQQQQKLEQNLQNKTVDAGGDSTSTRRGPRTQSKIYRYIFSCLDVFSRQIWLEPMTSKETSNHAVQALWYAWRNSYRGRSTTVAAGRMRFAISHITGAH
jgi:hypothetical protein